jgi:hypothetical protein
MSRSNDWRDDDERPTSRGGKGSGSRTDTDHTVGQLMVESLNHLRRIQVLEERVEILEAAKKNQSLAPSSLPPAGKQRVFALIRKTVTYTVVAIAAVVSALKELGFLGH